MNSKGPCYGWRWKQFNELWHPTDFIAIGDELDDQVKNKYPDLAGKYVGRHGWAATPINPGEGYRLLGWDEEMANKHVEITPDGYKWSLLRLTQDDYPIERPRDHHMFNDRDWLAARVPVEPDPTHKQSEKCCKAIAEAECRTWNEAIETIRRQFQPSSGTGMIHHAYLMQTLDKLKKGPENGTEND